MIKEIKKFDAIVLKTKAKKIIKINQDIFKLVKDLEDTMYNHCALGVTANQIDILKRIFVINPKVLGIKKKESVFINPVIIKKEGILINSEACLSFPNTHLITKRAKKIAVIAKNLKGKVFKLNAENLLAKLIQHEIDHLDGILFFEREVSNYVK